MSYLCLYTLRARPFSPGLVGDSRGALIRNGWDASWRSISIGFSNSSGVPGLPSIRGEIFGRTQFGLIRRSFISGGVLTTHFTSKKVIPIRSRVAEERRCGMFGVGSGGASVDTLSMSEIHAIGRLIPSMRYRFHPHVLTPHFHTLVVCLKIIRKPSVNPDL